MGYHMSMVLNSDYAGWLELYSPYSANKTKLKVGRPGDKVKIVSRWVDRGETWVLVNLNDEFEGWVLEQELSNPDDNEN